MFFEGCPANLGCTIKLRGAAEYELARVKEILMLMVCVAYHSQLEISFLMDEFAMPPSLAPSTSFPCLLEGSTAEEDETEAPKRVEEEESAVVVVGSGEAQGVNGTAEDAVHVDVGGGEGGENDTKREPGEGVPVPAPELMAKLGEEEKAEEEMPKPVSSSSPRSSMEGDEAVPAMNVTSSSIFSAKIPPPAPFLLVEEEPEMKTLTRVEEDTTAEEGSTGTGETLCAEDDSETPPPARLFQDPLQDDTGMFVAEQVASCDDRLKSLSTAFRQELKDIILCISPFISFREPFLLTAAGLQCPSRDYFPEQVWLPFRFPLFELTCICTAELCA